jgi:hypothetical protein
MLWCESDEPFRWPRELRRVRHRFRQSWRGRRDWPRLLTTLRNYLIANNLSADWDRTIARATSGWSTRCRSHSHGEEEKQYSARGSKARAALVALAEMELASRDDGSGTSIQ